ncbi:acyltransferase [Brevibacillus centrosporus]|uniref:acyltransferase n=1 Tax=Brevibacillus centrosporus TaxID=54910 RepID=UPI003B02EA20
MTFISETGIPILFWMWNQTNELTWVGDIYIGDHVWLGAHVNVLKGVTIGENSVIGIRSLVISDIPSHCVAAGLPAKVKRSNTYWTRDLIEGEERSVSS